MNMIMQHVDMVKGHFFKTLGMARGYWICFVPMALAILSGIIFKSDYDAKWYQKIKKPRFNPPNWVFAPVWTFLYLQIGYAIHMIIEYPAIGNWRKVIPQLAAIGVNLVFNYSWSVFFFRRHEIRTAFYISCCILATAVVSVFMFAQARQHAAVQLVPYTIWVLYATMLNYRIWQDNKPSKINIFKKDK